jgi:hypothetical protein
LVRHLSVISPLVAENEKTPATWEWETGVLAERRGICWGADYPARPTDSLRLHTARVQGLHIVPLVLCRASVSRGPMVGGRSRRVCWPASVGRIFKAEAGYPEETPWMWKIVFHERKPPGRRVGRAGHD